MNNREMEQEVRNIVAKVEAMSKRFSDAWKDDIAQTLKRHVDPEMQVISAKMATRVKAVGVTPERALQAARDLVDEFEKVLEGLDIKLVVNDKPFPIKGF